MSSASVELLLLSTISPPTLSTSFVNTVELIQFCFWCFTVPFYSFLLFFMIDAQFKKIEELNTPFFKLCISTAVIDLLTLFTNYFGLMFPKHGVFLPIYLHLDYIYAHIYLYIAWSTGICQAMSVSVLATNRLSAMIFPYKYQKMWSGHRIKIAYVIQFIPGSLMGLSTFFNTAELFANESQGIVPKFTNPKMTLTFFTIGGGFLLANSVYLIFAYFYLFKILHKRNTSSVGVSSVKVLDRTHQKLGIKNREKRLFVMCSIIVSVQLIILLFFSCKMFGVFQMSIDEFYVLYSILSDLFASINPYLLWIFSDSLRKYILQKFGIQKSTSSMKSIGLSTTSSFAKTTQRA